MTKNLYITGGTGTVGSALIGQWLNRGEEYRVIVQTRNPDLWSQRKTWGDRARYVSSYHESGVDAVDAIVNLAGAPIDGGRWTDKRKAVLRESRIGLTKTLVKEVSESQVKPNVVISGSAIGYYGDTEECVSEDGASGEGFAAELCRDWEAAAKPFEEMSRLVVLRLGVVFSHKGALARMLPIFKLGLGGPIGRGTHWFSWIHLKDLVAIILSAIDNEDRVGVYNATAPNPVRQKDFAKAFGNVLNRPAVLPAPPIALELAFGQMAKELLTHGQCVKPQRLEDSGHAFRYENIETALADLCS